MPRRWMYARDIDEGHTRIVELDPDNTLARDGYDTPILQDIYASRVVGGAPSGLRRYVLEEQPDTAMLRETGEVVPLTPEIAELLRKRHTNKNSWNMDHVHEPTELDTSAEAAVRAALTAAMARHPYTFEIVGLQRRFLHYFSDGTARSQQHFLHCVPVCRSSPFDPDTGALLPPYRPEDFISSADRDAGRYMPDGKPLLYQGPAWLVRFTLDGQSPAYNHCAVYVTDTGDFICSDWCQRHDYSSYSHGINLQVGLYTFDGWVVGPCVGRAIEETGFRPTGATVERTAVRQLLKDVERLRVPTFEEAMARRVAAESGEFQTYLVERVRAVLAERTTPPSTARIEEWLLADVAVAHRAGRLLDGTPVLVPVGGYPIGPALLARWETAGVRPEHGVLATRILRHRPHGGALTSGYTWMGPYDENLGTTARTDVDTISLDLEQIREDLDAAYRTVLGEGVAAPPTATTISEAMQIMEAVMQRDDLELRSEARADLLTMMRQFGVVRYTFAPTYYQKGGEVQIVAEPTGVLTCTLVPEGQSPEAAVKATVWAADGLFHWTRADLYAPGISGAVLHSGTVYDAVTWYYGHHQAVPVTLAGQVCLLSVVTPDTIMLDTARYHRYPNGMLVQVHRGETRKLLTQARRDLVRTAILLAAPRIKAGEQNIVIDTLLRRAPRAGAAVSAATPVLQEA